MKKRVSLSLADTTPSLNEADESRDQLHPLPPPSLFSRFQSKTPKNSLNSALIRIFFDSIPSGLSKEDQKEFKAKLPGLLNKYPTQTEKMEVVKQLAANVIEITLLPLHLQHMLNTNHVQNTLYKVLLEKYTLSAQEQLRDGETFQAVMDETKDHLKAHIGKYLEARKALTRLYRSSNTPALWTIDVTEKLTRFYVEQLTPATSVKSILPVLNAMLRDLKVNNPKNKSKDKSSAPVKEKTVYQRFKSWLLSFRRGRG